jgi:hypothetical protein
MIHSRYDEFVGLLVERFERVPGKDTVLSVGWNEQAHGWAGKHQAAGSTGVIQPAQRIPLSTRQVEGIIVRTDPIYR